MLRQPHGSVSDIQLFMPPKKACAMVIFIATLLILLHYYYTISIVIVTAVHAVERVSATFNGLPDLENGVRSACSDFVFVKCCLHPSVGNKSRP